MYEEVWVWKQSNRLGSAWHEFPRWAHHPEKEKRKRMDLSSWNTQSSLFHFLSLLSCLSKKVEPDAGGLLNYGRWTRVTLWLNPKKHGLIHLGMISDVLLKNALGPSSEICIIQTKLETCLFLFSQNNLRWTERLIPCSGTRLTNHTDISSIHPCMYFVHLLHPVWGSKVMGV